MVQCSMKVSPRFTLLDRPSLRSASCCWACTLLRSCHGLLFFLALLVSLGIIELQTLWRSDETGSLWHSVLHGSEAILWLKSGDPGSSVSSEDCLLTNGSNLRHNGGLDLLLTLTWASAMLISPS